MGSGRLDTVHVHFIDFGNDDFVQNVFPLGSQFTQLQAQSVHCSLHNIVPAAGKKDWSEEPSDFFNEYVGDRLFTMIVKGVVHECEPTGGSFENPLVVELIEKEKGHNVSDFLVDSGMAR